MKRSLSFLFFLMALQCLGGVNASAQGNVTYQDGWPRPNYRVNDMVLSNGVLYFVGSFTRVGNVQRNGGAAIDVATGTLLPWNPNVQVDTVVQGIGPNTVAKKGDTIFLGGYFTHLGGQPCNSFGAVNATTGARLAWDPGFATTNNYPYVSIFTLLVNDNTLYVGGAIDSVGGVRRKCFAAINIATGALLPFNANVGGNINTYGMDMAMGSNALYLCGSFSDVGGQTRQRVASVDPVTGAINSWNPMGYGGYTQYGAQHLAVKDNTVYIGGVFYYMQGVERTHLCAVNATTGALLPWNPIPEAPVDVIAPIGNIVYLGGRFVGMGSPYQQRWRAAAVDATTGALKSWNPNAYGPVYSIIPDGNSVYLGGLIYYMSGDSSRKHLVAVSKQSDIIAGATVASPSSGCGPGFTTNLSLNGTSGADSFQWQRSPNDSAWTNIAGATSASYSLYVSDTTYFRCRLRSAGTQDDYSARVWVRVNKPVPTVSIIVPSLICLNEDAFFMATGTNLGTAPAYQWYFKDSLVSTDYYYISPRIDANIPEELHVVVTNINTTCAATSVESEHKMLTSLPAPDRNTTYTTASGSAKLCEGDTITFKSKASLSPNSVGATYEWYYNYDVVGTGPTYTATAPGGYNLFVTYANGCGRMSPERYITPVPVLTTGTAFGNSTQICSGDAVQLETSNIAGASYHWKLNGSNKGTGYTQLANAPGMYTVSVSVNGCPSKSDTVIITEKVPDLSVSATGSTSFCTPGATTISAVSNWMYTYQWYRGSTKLTGETNETYTAISSGSYRVGITDNSCWGSPEKKSAITTVSATTTPANASVSRLTKQTAYWTLRANPGTMGYTYEWYKDGVLLNGVTSRDYNALVNGSYTVIVSNGSCASGMSTSYLVNSTTFPPPGARMVAAIDEGTEPSISIYPNPSEGIFYIGSEEPVNVIVKDVQGRTIVEAKNASSIDLSAQPAGMYVFSITNAQGKLLQVERVVKQ